MAHTSIGDMAQHFMSLRSVAASRTRLVELAGELSSGEVRDPAARLGGRVDLLADADRRIARYSADLAATGALSRRFDTAQIALDQIEGQRSILSAELLALPPRASPQILTAQAARAEAAFSSVINALGARHGTESLFSGTATDRAPLAPPGAILAALRAEVAGAADNADVMARVETFFDDPSGGFATMAYHGDNGPPPTRWIDGQEIELAPRADDPSLRAVMKALALAALATEAPVGADPAARTDLMHRAGRALMAAAEPLVTTRARLGAVQEQADTALSRQSAALSATRIQRHEMTAANAEETAVSLRQVQTQLETQYAVSARLAGLSLTGYLR
ncbi:MAG: hypothetical protein IT542_03530 [Rubellimicrobium sp.]|nr:hypothetical protein [Rubellimicrobium sp.]